MKNLIFQKNLVVLVLLASACSILPGCSGYSSQSLYPQEYKSVRLEMFDNQSFWRDVEYDLTAALGKRIEANSPYKIITSTSKADTVLSGQIISIGQGILSLERQTGRPLETEVRLAAVINWKDLKTGQLLIDNQTVEATASYSEWLNQGFENATAIAANKLAIKIVEQMEIKW